MNNDKTGQRTWSAISAGAFLIAVALGIILFWATKQLIDAFGAFILVFGIYMIVASTSRPGKEDAFGASNADAALAGGAILAGLGIVCFIWSYTADAMITAAIFIVMIAAIGMLMAYKNRGI